MPAEQRGRIGAPRILAVAALLWCVTYLTWRLGWTISGTSLWLSVPLVAAEIWVTLRLAMFAVTAWRVPRSTVVPGPSDDPARVELVVPSVGRDAEAVGRTLVVAAVARPGRIRVFDTERRADVEREALRHGAEYRVAAGRCSDDADLANAELVTQSLADCSAEFVAWVDAGDVATPALIGLTSVFDDPTVAVVQAATDYSNRDSLLHTSPDRDEHAVADRVVGPAMDAAGGAPWNGSGSLFRVAALNSVGGLAAGCGATRRTALRLQRRGWKVRFSSDAVVRVAAPDDLDDYLDTEAATAHDDLRVLLGSDSPLTGRHLSFRSRVASIAAGTRSVDALARLTFLAVLAAVLLSGQVPLEASALGLAVLWAPAFVLRSAATVALARGNLRWGDPTRQGLRTMGADLGAVFGRRRLRRSTGTGGAPGIRVLGHLGLVTFCAVVINLAVLVRALSFWLPDVPGDFTSLQRLAVMAVAIWTIVPMVDVLQVLVGRHQRRQHHRVGAELVAQVDGAPCRAVDLTPHGLGLVQSGPAVVGDRLKIVLTVPRYDGTHSELELTGLVRHASNMATGSWSTIAMWRVGVWLVDVGPADQDVLVEFCALTADERDVGRDRVPHTTPDELSVSQASAWKRSLAALNVVGLVTAAAVVMAVPASAGEAATRLAAPTVVTGPNQTWMVLAGVGLLSSVLVALTLVRRRSSAARIA